MLFDTGACLELYRGILSSSRYFLTSFLMEILRRRTELTDFKATNTGTKDRFLVLLSIKKAKHLLRK